MVVPTVQFGQRILRHPGKEPDHTEGLISQGTSDDISGLAIVLLRRCSVRIGRYGSL